MQKRNVVAASSRTKTRCLIFMLVSMISLSPFQLAASTNPTIPRDVGCKAEFDAVGIAILTEIEGHGARQGLTIHLNAAWNLFWNAKNPIEARERLDELKKLLGTNGVVGISPESKQIVSELVDELRRCIVGGRTPEEAFIAVEVYYFDETTPDGKGERAGRGVYLFVDGTYIKSTDDDGRARLMVPTGLVAVQAIVPSSAIANASVEAVAGTTIPIQLILDDGKEVVSPAEISISSVKNSILPADADDFTITLLEGGVPRPVVYVGEVALEDDIGNTLAHLTDEFRVDAEGRLYPVTMDVIRKAIAPHAGRSLRLIVNGVDALGFTLGGYHPLYLGQHILNAVLVASPSHPSLSVAGIEITYNLMGTDLTLTRTTDATGAVSFGSVPLGNATLKGMTIDSGLHYHGDAMFFLRQSSVVKVLMAHPKDILAGHAKYEIVPLASPNRNVPMGSGQQIRDEDEDGIRRRLHRSIEHLHRSGTMESEGISLRVGAAGAGEPVTASRVLTIPQGTRRVLLRYRVSTAEYPYFVTRQSVFNDTWSLSLSASQGGSQLFNIDRNVNAQLRGAPAWRADGTTGYISQYFDVASLTVDGTADLALTATAVNVADSLLPTVVHAILSEDVGKMIITTVVPDELSKTRGDHATYSIPFQGENNQISRWYSLKLDKPAGTRITRVRAELEHGSDSMQGGLVLDEGIGQNVRMVDDNTVRVRVTLHSGSGVNTVPPPAHTIYHKFTVEAETPDGNQVSAEASSAPRRALWRMQEAWRVPERRYGMRDVGGDDWLSARTWEYLDRHGVLLTRIDDISGEHGSNIGHRTHDVGTDIDLYHVYQFPGTIRGEDNYFALRRAVVRVLSLPERDAADDRARVLAWVSQTRARFAEILTTTDAEAIYYSVGSDHVVAGVILPRGWARNLLVDGVLTVPGHRIDTGLGPWGFPQERLRYDEIHNSHFHIKRPRER